MATYKLRQPDSRVAAVQFKKIRGRVGPTDMEHWVELAIERGVLVPSDDGSSWLVKSFTDTKLLLAGDYLIRTADGAIWPMSEKSFLKTYEPDLGPREEPVFASTMPPISS